MSSTENRPGSLPNRGRSDTDNDSTTKGVDDPTRPSGRKSEDGCDASVSTVVPAGQDLDGTPPTPASRCDENAVEGEIARDLPAGGSAPLGTLALAPKWTVEPDTKQKELSPIRDSEAPMVTGGCSGKGNGSGRIWSTAPAECKGSDSSTVASLSMTPASMQRSLPPPLPSRSPLLLPPPPPPQQTPNAAGGAGSGGGVGIGGTTALRDLDGCLVWYTDDSAGEADIESMASVASVDSREDDLEAAASTDSEVASTASSTGGASSVASGDSFRSKAVDRDLSLSICSNWNNEGEEDVLLGLSLARARCNRRQSMSWYNRH